MELRERLEIQSTLRTVLRAHQGLTLEGAAQVELSRAPSTLVRWEVARILTGAGQPWDRYKRAAEHARREGIV